MQSQPYRIGYYDDSVGPGGTTRYLRELIAALPRDQFRPTLFAPTSRAWHRDLAELDVEIVTLDPPGCSWKPLVEPGAAPSPTPESASPASRRARPALPRPVAWTLGLAREVRRLERLFRLREVDLLHSNNCGAEAAPLAARRAGAHRILGTWHVDSTYDLDRQRDTWYYRQLERASMRALDRAIAVSAATREDWLRRCRLDPSYAARVSVVHNGVDLSRLTRRRSRTEAKQALGLPPQTLVLGSLGRLEAAKGYRYLLSALPGVLREHPETVAVIGGRGPLREELEAQAKELGVAHAVRWAGFVADVREVLEAADVYVQPSLCEALPLGVLEALGMGMPAVVSRVGGMAEAIEGGGEGGGEEGGGEGVDEGVIGSVVPARDPESLAAALNHWLAHPTARARADAAAPQRVRERFTMPRMGEETAAIYRDLLAGRVHTAPRRNTGSRVTPGRERARL